MDADDLDYDVPVHNNVARTTASGIEMLLLYLETEMRRVRYFLRNCGGRFRRFCFESVRIDFRNVALFLSRITNPWIKQVCMDDAGLNVDEAIVFNTVPLRSRWRPSKYTFNDIAVVLTMDQEVEDGVVHAYMIRSPPWSSLPSPVLSHCRHDLVNFQLLNQPLKMASTVDDDDERLSLSSTVINSQDLKIQSLEAQLALLSKQMQALLAGKTPPADTVICNFEGSSVSDDEGKGASLGSPIETKKPIIHHEEKEMSKLPNVCPPFSLCPPPPPPLSLMSVQNVVAPEKQASTNRPTALQILGKSEKIEHESLPVRPSVSDLKRVQLRKTNTARSPGGTPLGRYLKQPADEGNYLANALREKFRSVQEYMSEHEEETNTSWLEDDS